MSEPTWELLGGGGVLGPAGIDYIGDWAAGTSYLPGQVVRYQGVDYLAVNPSLGQTPPAARSSLLASYGTTLPATPFDGQEAILVDSLTAPTYSWRFRYSASITDAYKWVFVGGSPYYAIYDAGAGEFVGNVWTYLVAPRWPVPRSGTYLESVAIRTIVVVNAVTVHLSPGSQNNTDGQESAFATVAANGNATLAPPPGRRTLAANETLGCWAHGAAGAYFGTRSILVTPVRVA